MYNINTKGTMDMKYDELLNKLTEEKKGVLTTKDAVALGVTKPSFLRFIERNGYERVAHGIYQNPDDWFDEKYVLSLRSPLIVFSHDSALDMHNMTDRVPLKHTVTVPTGYNPSRLTANFDIKVYTVKKELYELGIMESETMFGHTVKVYNPERTVCDIIRSRNGIEAQTFDDALKRYVERRGRNIPRLMQYARAFHIDKILTMYLRVLLP